MKIKGLHPKDKDSYVGWTGIVTARRNSVTTVFFEDSNRALNFNDVDCNGDCPMEKVVSRNPPLIKVPKPPARVASLAPPSSKLPRPPLVVSSQPSPSPPARLPSPQLLQVSMTG